MEVESYQESSVGAGSDTYFVLTKTRKYVLKFPIESEINNHELEPKPCNYLIIVWKLMRSYVYSAEECSNEKIDIDQLIEHVQAYLSFASLNEYDFKMIGRLFYY